MKKINELFSLEWASDCYFIDDNLNIVNIKTGNLKSKTIGKRGYYYVTLNRRDDNIIGCGGFHIAIIVGCLG